MPTSVDRNVNKKIASGCSRYEHMNQGITIQWIIHHSVFSAAMVRCPIIYFGARGDQYKNPKFSISFRIMSIFIIFAIHFQIIVHIYTSFQNLMFYQYRHSITNCLNQFHTNDCDILWKHHTICSVAQANIQSTHQKAMGNW